jgi:intracellular multiplication protein IcmE
MSDAARSDRMKFALPKPLGLLSGAGRAGPRRLAVLTVGGLAVAGLVVVVVTGGYRAPPVSKDARMQTVDPLPGGLHGTPEQSALARVADTRHAELAMAHGVSFTPPLAPSVPVVGPPPDVQRAAARAAPPPQPHFVTRPAPPPPVVPVVAQVAFPPPADTAPALARPIRVAAVADPQQQAVYAKEISDLFSQWDGRAPETNVILPPRELPAERSADGAVSPATSASPAVARVTQASAPDGDAPQVLIPAGRGVYAHPLLALSSDQTSPVVLQADSGPIAGDRMIGSFARENDRLIIHLNSIIHDGQTIACDGVVVAPDTMEASVASGVNEHYLTRFILPAAAAFVQGLGQALATTSNTAAVLSPFGGASYVTRLNLSQQMGVAAGVAAGQIGATLNQQAPKGPTVTLAANVAVGVMFLSNVTLPRRD